MPVIPTNYIAGVIFDDNTVVDIPAPDAPAPSMYAFPGERTGLDNGCKGKLDYQGNFWMIATDGSGDKYLLKIHWVSGISFTIAYKQIPRVSIGQSEYILSPNQLTVDHNGNVYIPSGTLDAAGLDTVVVMKLSNTSDADPANWVFTPLTNGDAFFNHAIGTFGIALNEAHTKVLTHMHSTNAEAESDAGIEIDISSMTITFSHNLTSGILDEGTYNIETDVSDSINEGYSYFITTATLPSIVVWEWGVGDVYTYSCDGADLAERVLEINTNGFIYTMERMTHCSLAPNPLRLYVPTVVGRIAYISKQDMTCDIQITVPPQGPGGTTGTMQAPTHHSILRSDNTVWPATGINPTRQADVRRISTSSQICRSRTAIYHYMCTASQREPWNTPSPPLPPVWGLMRTFVVTPQPARGVDVYFCFSTATPDGTQLLIDWGDGTTSPYVTNHNQCHTKSHTYTLAPGTSVTIRVTTLDGRLFVWSTHGYTSEDTIVILA